VGLLDRVAQAVARKLADDQSPESSTSTNSDPCPQYGAPPSKRVEASLGPNPDILCGACAYQFQEGS